MKVIQTRDQDHCYHCNCVVKIFFRNFVACVTWRPSFSGHWPSVAVEAAGASDGSGTAEKIRRSEPPFRARPRTRTTSLPSTTATTATNTHKFLTSIFDFNRKITNSFFWLFLASARSFVFNPKTETNSCWESFVWKLESWARFASKSNPSKTN